MLSFYLLLTDMILYYCKDNIQLLLSYEVSIESCQPDPESGCFPRGL